MIKSVCNTKGCPFFGGYCRVHLPWNSKEHRPIEKESKKRAEVNRKHYGPKSRAFVADNPKCQVGSEVCTGKSQCVHHMIGKSSTEDLLNDKYWMASCIRCNNFIEDNDAYARSRGWKLSKFSNRMSQVFTIKDLERLQASGKIRGYKIPEKIDSQNLVPQNAPKSKIKDWIHRNLVAWCEGNGYGLFTEQRFDEKRRWRIDWVVYGKGKPLAIEYEGIFSAKSRHTTIKGFMGDMEKYNMLTALGIPLIRISAFNYKNIINELDNLFK